MRTKRVGSHELAWGVCVLVTALLGCTTRVGQAVTRYSLSLSSPMAEQGARCWDSCIHEPNSAIRAACLSSCPGVEVRAGEGCNADGRKPVTELCHTHVFNTRAPDEGNGEMVGMLTQTLVESAFETASRTDDSAEQHESEPAAAPASPAPYARAKRPHSPAKPAARPARVPASVGKRHD